MDTYLDFMEFEHIVRNPRRQLQKYLNAGKKVIGCFPLYTPEQIVYAAGMIPFGMWGADIQVNCAKKYFPAYVCGIMQTNLELGITGAYTGLSGVMMTLLCDSLKCATQNWKYAVPDIEVIPVVHPQNRTSGAAYAFLYEQYSRIKERMEAIAGNKITEEDFQYAIDVYNAHQKEMQRFVKLAGAHPAEVSPRNRCAVIKSGYFMDKAEHTRLVRKINERLKDIPGKRFRGIRVVTTGIIADSIDLLDIFEENKVSIAADDVAHESRQFRTGAVYEKDGISALVKQFLQFQGCSTVIGGKAREDLILELVHETGADGVIVLMTKFCDPEEYDYPLIKEKLEQHGIPMFVIEVDKQIDNYGQAATAVQTFQEMVRL